MISERPTTIQTIIILSFKGEIWRKYKNIKIKNAYKLMA